MSELLRLGQRAVPSAALAAGYPDCFVFGVWHGESAFVGASPERLVRLDGRAVLREMKQDPELLRIPVIVLSTSKAESDIAACYDAHANCYLAKPVDVLEFNHLVELIRDFWFGVVQLPAA